MQKCLEIIESLDLFNPMLYIALFSIALVLVLHCPPAMRKTLQRIDYAWYVCTFDAGSIPCHKACRLEARG